ncbi:hypothetical protein DOT_1444 [Desulfosporosinus sp. OT]|nr:hypothetical protein DOT_1444 [Desulfosporosinus sp. OT]
MVSSQRTVCVQADNAIVCRIIQYQLKSLLPLVQRAVLINAVDYFTAKDPTQQFIYIVKMIVKCMSCESTVIGNHLDMNMVNRVG